MATRKWARLQRAGLVRPRDRRELRLWVQAFLKMEMPERGMCAGHCSPLDYLVHSFFEGGEADAETRRHGDAAKGDVAAAAARQDAVVWACRGGGKTMVGAVATLLDLLFKPGIQVRILGGSLDQSDKMYAYLRGLVRRHFEDLLAAEPTQRRLTLTNGSRVDVLAQSDRSVRGQRVQKLRCDEVELFDPEVWQAAQLTTRSLDGPPRVRGAVEAFSTMHRPGGLMQQIMANCRADCRFPIANFRSEEGAALAGGGRSAIGNWQSAIPRRVFAWCVWDVIEKCPARRACAGCALWDACQGRAKGAEGFVKIDDVMAMRGRVSRGTWEHEMLCWPPRFEDAVFGAFRRERHVRAAPAAVRAGAGRVAVEGRVGEAAVEAVICGVDFGYAQAFVCLWVAVMRDCQLPIADCRSAKGAVPGGNGLALGNGRSAMCVWVFDEMVTSGQTVGRNAAAMRARCAAGAVGMPAVVYCDVAGTHVNSQTAATDERVLREAGFVTRSRAMRIEEGIDLISDLLDPAAGEPRLLIDPKCVRLIEAMEGYRRGSSGKAEKDGRHDHLIDALRYALVGHWRAGGKVEVRRY